MNATFFGTPTDLAWLWKWVAEIPGMRVFEDSSVPDQPNRWFDDLPELASYLDRGGRSLAAWPESVGGRPRAEPVIFTPEAQRKLGATGRTLLHSPAMIRIVGRSAVRGCLADTAITYWTEKGARQRSACSEDFLNEVDWPQFTSIAGRVGRAVRKAAPAKLRAYPIMPDAFEKLKANEIKLWFGGEVGYPSPLITLC